MNIGTAMAISALQAQEAKTQLSREDTTLGVQKTCITCKHYPPESKWPCIDCDMLRNPADRWEPQELSKNSPKLDKKNGDLQPTCNQLEKDICVPCKDTISRQAAIDAVKHAWAKGLEPSQYIEELPSVQPEPISEAYAKAVFTWLFDYQIKAAELKGRYTPYEVLSWVVNDWRKEHEGSD